MSDAGEKRGIGRGTTASRPEMTRGTTASRPEMKEICNADE